MKQILSVRLDGELIQRFKRFVLGKYGKLYGSLGTEVESALNSWLNDHGLIAHTNTRMNPGLPKTQLISDRLINRLRARGCHTQCTLKDLRRAIMDERGSDPRTIRKWIKTLVQIGRIKRYAYQVWEII